MPGQFNIELKGLRFFAGHGMYEEEYKVGNEFEVDISIDTLAPELQINSLAQTVDYVAVYRIVQEEFRIRQYYIETCAMQIADKLELQFPQINKIIISIRKLNAPITNFTGSVGVTYTRSASSRD
jgi:7,8-dihydroneopterin aldolase/epimerase/oxygenase